MGSSQGNLAGLRRNLVTLDIACPECGEATDLTGSNNAEGIVLACGRCGHQWSRTSEHSCDVCGSKDLQTVPLAIVERSRGTQLSVVGTRQITLCSVCDHDRLATYHANRPNPLMPENLPTVGEEQMNG